MTAQPTAASNDKPLVSQYRAIGPAAVIAALLCASRTRLKNSFGR